MKEEKDGEEGGEGEHEKGERKMAKGDERKTVWRKTRV